MKIQRKYKQTIKTLEEYTIKSCKVLNKCKTNNFSKITNDQENNKLMIRKYCYCSFTEKNKKIIHHEHTTGNYIISICSVYNLNYQYKKNLTK